MMKPGSSSPSTKTGELFFGGGSHLPILHLISWFGFGKDEDELR